MPAPKTDGMRGLAVFISDMRNCKSKEEEERRINKELANIRSKFKGDKALDGYQKKKYVCKLLFIFLLGHDIDFGYNEAVNLLCSNKYSEKQMGYLFISILVCENHSLMNLVVASLKKDLTSRTPVFVNLALQCIANIGTQEMASNFANEIPKLLLSGDMIDSTKQNAALCLLRFIRIAPELVTYDEWTNRAIHLLNDQHLGVVTSAVSLIEALVQRSPQDYKGCVSFAVSRLNRLVTSSYADFQDYTYYFVTAPWLCVKLLRLLQNYPPPEDPAIKQRLTECLDCILKKVNEPPKSKKVQHPNAKNAILFEAINLIINMDCDQRLLVRASNQLGQFLQNKETNLRYLALESLCLLATSEYSHDAVKKHQDIVVSSLKGERDVSVRQKAVDLLYAMCDRTNAQTIVAEMLAYLETADYSIREEMVLKVAILSEKYATDYAWYVDTILTLIRVAGDYVSEEVWHRVIQIVVNREDLRGYVAKTVFEALQAPACHENMVKVGGYILGEFGNLIAGDERSLPQKQFQLLHDKYYLCAPSTRQLLLSTYAKFINLFPEIKDQIQEALLNDSNSRSSNVEIQQRAVEYLTLSNIQNSDIMVTVFEVMPPFPERESSILSKLKSKRPGQTILSPGHTGKAISALSSTTVKSAQGDELNGEPSALTGAPTTPGLGNGGEVDLLGLEASTPTTNNAPVENGGEKAETNAAAASSADMLLQLMDQPMATPPITNREQFNAFICKCNGVLFENDLVQVGIKSEYHSSQGRLNLYYGNKAAGSLVELSAEVSSDTAGASLVFTAQQLPNFLASGSLVQQMVGVECLSEFDGIPVLTLRFNSNNVSSIFCMYLPLTLNKFMVPAEMNRDAYVQRWQNLTQPGQESQKVFDAKKPMDAASVTEFLKGFGFAVLPDIDPSPSNHVCAGVIHITGQQLGVLARLEPNMEVKKYRLTIRSIRASVSTKLSTLVSEHL